MGNLAPIILFVYNRPSHTLQTLEALMQNHLAPESELYIFSDGPRAEASLEDQNKIKEVRHIIKEKRGFKKLTIFESSHNKGLADSIVEGVTKIVNEHGKIIVLEDDIVTSVGFLQYMNGALELYENENSVMHITGFMYPNSSDKLSDTFFYPLPYPGGGWATWRRAWKYYNHDALFLFNYFDKNKKWAEFNTDGGHFFLDQLKKNVDGSLKTWFVKWHATLLMQKGLTLFPKTSLIHNSGFDNSGENSAGFTEYNGKIAEYIPIKIIPVKKSKLGETVIKQFYKNLFSNNRSISTQQKLKSKLKRSIPFKSFFKKTAGKLIKRVVPEVHILEDRRNNWSVLKSLSKDVTLGHQIKINEPYSLDTVSIGDYTYVAANSNISGTFIGKFCSIGPNLLCGSGIHPMNGLSTSPMFYSTLKQNGISLSKENKIEERKRIHIGNDVFVGANVSILDGVSIGDGAVVGAGAVVSKDIPPYAIAVGNPIKILRYRFKEGQIEGLLNIKWWNFNEDQLSDIEKYFYDIDSFIQKYRSE